MSETASFPETVYSVISTSGGECTRLEPRVVDFLLKRGMQVSCVFYIFHLTLTWRTCFGHLHLAHLGVQVLIYIIAQER